MNIHIGSCLEVMLKEVNELSVLKRALSMLFNYQVSSCKINADCVGTITLNKEEEKVH